MEARQLSEEPAAAENGLPAAERSGFAAGSWVIPTYVAWYQSFDDNLTDVFDGRMGAEYYFADHVAVNLELHGTGFRDATTRTGGGGVALGARWHWLRRARWTVFAEGDIGPMATLEDFPPGGTQVNFTVHLGLGITAHLFDRVHFLGGVRWFHVANGGLIAGSGRDPGFDSGGLYLGYLFEY